MNVEQLERKITNVFKLTTKERYILLKLWNPRIGQRAIHISGIYEKELKQRLNSDLFFDKEGRCKGNYLSSCCYEHSFVINEIDGDVIISNWYIDNKNQQNNLIYRHKKENCLPALSKWELFWIKRKIRKELTP